MKRQSAILFTKLSNVTLADLRMEVKETIAFEMVATQKKIFTEAQLWYIQRQAKMRAQRRYL